MTTNIYLDIIEASIFSIVFKPYNEIAFIEKLTKSSIKLSVNNEIITTFSLNEDHDNQKYILNFPKDNFIDYYDTILLYIDDLNYKSDIYVIYLHQIFYNGEAFNLLPNLPLDITENAQLIVSLLKANNKTIPAPPKTIYNFLSGVGDGSDIFLPNVGNVGEDIDLYFLLKNLSNENILDSNYIVDIQLSKL